MIDRGKRNVLGVLIDEVDYEGAVERITSAATSGRRCSCTALAVHGVMTGVLDREQRYRLNALDLVTPDGQPVRWALNALHRSRLPDRVYGPNLMLAVCESAAAAGLPIYLFGSSTSVVEKLRQSLLERFPGLLVAGAEPSAFKRLGENERLALIRRIRGSGAAITFVGLGCPRQEVFAYECASELSMPVISVGAAFDYHAGVSKEPAPWIQRLGLQWAYRLAQDPRRLWKRYLGLNTMYVALLALQLSRAWRPRATGAPPTEMLGYG
ncbi:MAG TPA: WecB/TagA/CpsF family glycosyltransferase [Polyangia bacterium]|nr:WecB/TagA/CpsF family glycosyltransferase [Polyangia bacterium]